MAHATLALIGQAEVLFEFTATDARQIDLQVGQRVSVIRQHASGWWEGKNASGDVGFFPGNRVQLCMGTIQDDATRLSLVRSLKVDSPDAFTDSEMSRKHRESVAGGDPDAIHIPQYKSEPASEPPSLPPASMLDAAQVEWESEQPMLSTVTTRDSALSMHAEVVEFPDDAPLVTCDDDKINPDGSPKFAKVFRRRSMYGVYATNLAFGSGVLMLLHGIVCMSLGLRHDAHAWEDVVVGVLLIGSSAGVFAYELLHMDEREPRTSALRAAVYLALGGVACISLPARVPGACLVLTALANWVSWKQREMYRPSMYEIYDLSPTLRQRLKWHLATTPGVYITLLLYFALNVYLYVEWHRRGQRFIDERYDPHRDHFSRWYTIASGCGVLLSLNLPLLVVPLCFGIRDWMVKKAHRNGCCSGCFQFITEWISKERAVHFHRIISLMVCLVGVGHTCAHLLTYAKTPSQWLEYFGWMECYSGMLLMVLLVVIMAGTTEDVVKSHRELFRYSHFLWLLVYIGCLVHAPRFWQWFTIPAVVYTLDRLGRIMP